MFKKLILAASLAFASTGAFAWPTIDSDNGVDSVIKGASDVIDHQETQEVALFAGMVSQQYYFINAYACSNPPKKTTSRGAVFSAMAWTLYSSSKDMKGWTPEMVIEYTFKETYDCKDK